MRSWEVCAGCCKPFSVSQARQMHEARCAKLRAIRESMARHPSRSS